jgi:hypothetical protein
VVGVVVAVVVGVAGAVGVAGDEATRASKSTFLGICERLRIDVGR